MMNKFLTIALAALIGACGDVQEEKGVVVIGKVENPKSEDVYLVKFTLEGMKPVDTLEINDAGEFKLNLKVDEPTFYGMNFYNTQQVSLVLDGSEEEVKVELDGSNPSGEVTIEGSKHSAYLQQVQGMLKDQQSDIQDLNQQAIQAQSDGDTEAMERLTGEYYDLMRVRQQEVKEYIYSIAPSLAAYYGLESLSMDEHFTFYDSMSQVFNEKLPGHFITKNLNDRVSGARKVAIGAEAPEIDLPTPDGDNLALSSLKGKYVLVDFWAGWCRPCRMENPNVVALYNEYKDENFEILGVSLDKDKNSWVKAIDQDGLPWKHVSDLKYFNSVAAQDYQIQAIPATYLIDPEGTIIAKNLRGPALRAKLAEIFGEG